MGYQRFVALGDSCTEGLCDRYPGNERYRGWADLTAAALAEDTQTSATRTSGYEYAGGRCPGTRGPRGGDRADGRR